MDGGYDHPESGGSQIRLNSTNVSYLINKITFL
jgi:hypothetical protein